MHQSKRYTEAPWPLLPSDGNCKCFTNANFDFDVAIVGGGQLALTHPFCSALLGRSCRRVVVLDHEQPRNYAATAVHGYLGLDGIAPNALCERGHREAESYGVVLTDSEVITVLVQREMEF